MAIQRSKSGKTSQDDRLVIFKAGLWRTVFFEYSEE